MSKVSNKCVYCDLNFSSKAELKKHIEGDIVVCGWCNCEFEGEKKYFLHIKNCADETLNRKNATVKDNLIEIAKQTMLIETLVHVSNGSMKMHQDMINENAALHKKISVIDAAPKFFRKFCIELAYQFDESLIKVFEIKDNDESKGDKIGWWSLDKSITLPILVKMIALGGDRGKHAHKLANYLVNSKAWMVDGGTSYINHILNELIPVLEQFCEESKSSVGHLSTKNENDEFMKEVEMYYDAIFEENSKFRKDLVEQVKNSIFMENYKFLAEKDRVNKS